MVDENAPSVLLPVAVRTLGCKVNRFESDEIAAELLGRGVAIGDEDDAAVIVVNTCTVTGEADAKARKAVRHALGRAGNPVVVVTGCLATLDAAALRALSPRVIVEPDKGRVAEAVGEALGVADQWSATPATPAAPWGERFRARAMLKVQDGCDSFCAYCIVPYARGVPRSMPLRQIAERAAELVSAGAREIVLSGINIGRYHDGGHDLPDVVAAIAASGVARVRLSSIEPQHLSVRLLEVLASTPAACAHLHVPLQSGSDRVLGLMGRSYSREQFARTIAQARAALPGLSVTTDLIAGFPTETDADHTDGMAFVREMGFAKMHVFRYSERAGTPAASAKQVAPRVRARRAADFGHWASRCAATTWPPGRARPPSCSSRRCMTGWRRVPLGSTYALRCRPKDSVRARSSRCHSVKGIPNRSPRVACPRWCRRSPAQTGGRI